MTVTYKTCTAVLLVEVLEEKFVVGRRRCPFTRVHCFLRFYCFCLDFFFGGKYDTHWFQIK